MSDDAISFLCELFIQRLPTNMRTVLASADASMDIYKLADMADKVKEVTMPTVSDMKQLCEEVSHLTDLVFSLSSQSRH